MTPRRLLRNATRSSHGPNVGSSVGVALILALSAAPVAHTSAQSTLSVTFLDVGQGDAVLLRAPEGQTVLVDAGPGDPTGRLRALGVEQIDLLVASHPHADHIGGMAAVLDAFPVRFYMDSGKPHTTATYRALMRTLRDRTEITYLAPEPRTIQMGSAWIDVLPLPPADAVEHNDRSVGLVARFGAFVVFLSGDSERHELEHFLRVDGVPDVDLLKAPHHGSNNGFTRGFLETARPEVVVVSVGPNGYGHPRSEALSAYASIAEEVYRTDLQGTVTVLGYEDGAYQVHLAADGTPRHCFHE